MRVLEIGLNALATSRLTRLVVDDEITSDVRELLWKRFPVDKTKFGYALTCSDCTSVWVAALVTSGLLPRWTRDTLALSEAAILARRLLG